MSSTSTTEPQSTTASQPTPSQPAHKSTVDDALCIFLLQVVPAIVIAGLGTVLTGLLYDYAGKRLLFVEIHESYMLAPPILGLKGNVEMTLVSRLSTAVHRQRLRWLGWVRLVAVNLALLWVQAFALTALASALTVLCCGLEGHWPPAGQMVTLVSSALTATTLASLVLGSVMGLVVFVAHVWHVDPDNIATPLSASCSDVVTLFLFMTVGDAEVNILRSVHYAVNLAPVALGLCVFPVLVSVSYRNQDTKLTLQNGWFFLALAVVFSSMAGYVLKGTQRRFQDAAILQPLLSGLTGNRAAIQCSRLSTALHVSGQPRRSMSLAEKCNPIVVFSCQEHHSKCAVTLILTALPTQVMFFVILCSIYKPVLIQFEFLSILILCALSQITFLIYLSHCLVAFFWRFGFDPDDCAIPVITAIADFTGVVLLYLIFLLLDHWVPHKLRNP